MSSQKIQNSESEITIKDVFLFSRGIFNRIKKNWYFIVGLIILVFAYYKVSLLDTPKVYQATTKYILNEEGGSSSFGGILGQFGLGGGGGTASNMDRIIEISKSRNLIQECIFKKMYFEGDSIYIGNVIIELYKLNEIWSANREELLDWRFQGDDVETLDRQGRSNFKLVSSLIINGLGNGPLMTNTFENKTGIIELKVETINEQLSLRLSEILFYELRKFYDAKTTSKQQATLDVISEKKDSITLLLKQAEYGLAKYTDSNRNTISAFAKLPLQKFQQDVAKYRILLIKLSENEEVADFQLKNRKPFFEIIEDPMSPLRSIYMKTSTMIQYSVFLGVFFSLVFIFGQVFYEKILDDISSENE